MELAAAVASEYADMTHTDRVVSTAPADKKGLARFHVGARIWRLRSVFFEHMCDTNKNAPTYWDTHVPTALPTMPSFGGPSTRYRFRVQFNVDVSDATRSGTLESRAPRLAAVPTSVTSVAGTAAALMVRYAYAGTISSFGVYIRRSMSFPNAVRMNAMSSAAQRREAQRVRDVL
jgi:hypothetical protein